ncbi:hypothetical protein G6F56_006115 [Rhizopus delemar]|nr:hypothetical protein G6F56_006115 [Rhizopus delemar]
MSTLEHFVEPSTPGTQNAESSTRPKTQAVEQPEFESTLENTISIHTEYDDKEDIELLDPTIQTQIVLPSSLPIYRMPPSSDIVDFLSTIESKMNQENMLLKEFQKSRSKKLEILNNSRHYRSPRFYTSGSRRFHQKGKQ